MEKVQELLNKVGLTTTHLIIAVVVAVAIFYFFFCRRGGGGGAAMLGGGGNEHVQIMDEEMMFGGGAEMGEEEEGQRGGGGGTKMVLFYANWCGHCQALKPIWEQLEKKYYGDAQYQLVKYEAEANEDKMKEFEIEGFPTIMKFSDGQMETYSGDRSLADLERFLKE